MSEQANRVTKIHLNTKGIEPAQSSGFQPCLVPDGPYLLEVTDAWMTPAGTPNANNGVAANNATHVRFSIAEDPDHEGEFVGLDTEDFFSPVPPGPDDKIFPLQRFIALMVALGWEKLDREFDFDLPAMIGKQCWSVLRKRKQEASKDGQYAERYISRPTRYDPVNEETGSDDEEMDEEAEEPAPPVKTARAKRQPEPEPEDDETEDDEDEPAAAPAPVARSSSNGTAPTTNGKVSRAAAAAPTPISNRRSAQRPAAPVTVAADDDDEESDED